MFEKKNSSVWVEVGEEQLKLLSWYVNFLGLRDSRDCKLSSNQIIYSIVCSFVDSEVIPLKGYVRKLDSRLKLKGVGVRERKKRVGRYVERYIRNKF